MMKTKLKELIEQHGLPDVSQWVTIDEETSVTEIRKLLHEKLFGYVDTVDMLLHPDGVTSMTEAQEFSEAEHEALEEFYGKLKLLEKECILVDISATPKDEMALIKNLCEKWPAIVVEMKRIVEKTKGAYARVDQKSHRISYLG